MNANPPKPGRRARRNWLRFATGGLLVAGLVVAAFFAGRLSMLSQIEEAECQLEIYRDPDAAAEKAKEALVELMRETGPFAPYENADQIADMPLEKGVGELAHTYFLGPIWIDVEKRTYHAHVGFTDEPYNYFGKFDIRNGRWKAVPTEFIRERIARTPTEPSATPTPCPPPTN